MASDCARMLQHHCRVLHHSHGYPMIISRYAICEELADNDRFRLCRGRCQEDGSSVLWSKVDSCDARLRCGKRSAVGLEASEDNRGRLAVIAYGPGHFSPYSIRQCLLVRGGHPYDLLKGSHAL